MSKIRVEVRVKPHADNAVEIEENILKVGSKQFEFSRIHCDESQEGFFQTVLPLLGKFYENNDCTIFAYGQTGSGKTYTMGICENGLEGVLQMSLAHIFGYFTGNGDAAQLPNDGAPNAVFDSVAMDDSMSNMTLEYADPNDTSNYLTMTRPKIRITFYEIYNEEVFDLLSPVRYPLPLRENLGSITITGLREHPVRSLEDALVLLRQGCRERTTKATAMNMCSSRSHAIFGVHVNQAKLSFIDLAGSERLKRTKLTGKTVKESISINTGLLALGNVINALSAGKSYVPFRDSKLTRILQSSLKDNFTFMIVCISGKSIDFSETMNTLEYANRAANITTLVKNKVMVDFNGTLYLKEEILRLKGENQILRKQLKERCKCKETEKEHEKDINKLRMRVYELEEALSKCAFNVISPRGAPNRPQAGENKENIATNMKKDAEGAREVSYSAPSIAARERISPQKENAVLPDPTSSRMRFKSTSFAPNVAVHTTESSSNVPNKISNKESVGGRKRDYSQSISENLQSALQSNKSDVTALNNALMAEPKEKAGVKRVTFNTVENVILLTPKKQKKFLFTPGRDNITLQCTVRAFYQGHENSVTGLALLESLYSCSLDKTIREWPSGRIVHKDPFVVKSIVSWRRLLFTSANVLKCIDPREGTAETMSFSMPTAPVSAISTTFCEGDLLYVGTEDGNLLVVDLRMMNVLMKSQMHKGTIFCINRIDDHIYTGSRDHEIKRFIWPASNHFVSAAEDLTQNTQTPASDVVLRGPLRTEGTKMASPKGPEITALPTAHYDSVHILLNFNGLLVSGGRDCSIKVWKGLKIQKTVPYAHPSWIKSGSPTGAFYATGSKCGLVKFWDYKEKITCVGKIELKSSVNTILCDNENVYAGLHDKNIAVIQGRYE